MLDRLTGKVLLAEPFVKKLTWASGIGPDGRPKLLPGNEPTVEGQLVCPAVAGAANWPSTAFNPATGLFYMFAEESCNIYTKNDEWWEAGKSFYGGGTRRAPGDNGGKFLKAIDIQTGKTAWEIPDIGGGILQQRPDGDRRRTGLLRRRQRRVRRGRREERESCCGTSIPARAGRPVR